MDNRQGTALVLIDFSAAIDTVNHNIMIRHLQLPYGFVGQALTWLQSYLEGLTQRVVSRDASSNTTLWAIVIFAVRTLGTSLQRMDFVSITTLVTCSCTVILI